MRKFMYIGYMCVLQFMMYFKERELKCVLTFSQFDKIAKYLH